MNAGGKVSQTGWYRREEILLHVCERISSFVKLNFLGCFLPSVELNFTKIGTLFPENREIISQTRGKKLSDLWERKAAVVPCL